MSPNSQRNRSSTFNAPASSQPPARRKGGRELREKGQIQHSFMRITSVFDIYQNIRMVVGMIGNVWGWTSNCSTLFRQVLPGLARVHVGSDTYIVSGFLLGDLGTPSMTSSKSSLGVSAVTDPSVQEVFIRHPSTYFPHVIILLKLRWLLRLHSACCELDYKICSLRPLILGLQYVVLQQHSEMESDSVFDSKVSQHVGSHINLESVLDDLFDQLQKTLGGGWRGFLEYVQSCDPTRSLHKSSMDLAPPQIVSNETLSVVIDSVFVANFLRLPRSSRGAARLRDMFEELDVLGIAQPELPSLRGISSLKAWAVARTRPTRKDREKARGKEAEKLAQLDALLLCAAVELHGDEVMATAEELALDPAADGSGNGNGAAAVAAVLANDLGFTSPGSSGAKDQAAARVISEEKPKIKPNLFHGALQVVHYHDTFPQGIRERLHAVLAEEYDLSREQLQRIAIAATQNIDGKRLPDDVLFKMEHREKTRLRSYQSSFNSDTSHLLVPALVHAPIERGKPAKYTQDRPVGERPRFGSSFSSLDMTRSLPELRGFSSHSGDGRAAFRVPLTTGPLTMDHELKKLRTTGLFISMPPL